MDAYALNHRPGRSSGRCFRDGAKSAHRGTLRYLISLRHGGKHPTTKSESVLLLTFAMQQTMERSKQSRRTLRLSRESSGITARNTVVLPGELLSCGSA